MSSSKSPCAACKTLRRKCIDECVFAPYFPPDQPHRFQSVHSVYGASNVAKILRDIPTAPERAEAVTTLVYEAEARLKDPVYGCVGSISILQHKLKKIQTEIESAKQELATYIGPSAVRTVLNPGLMNQQPSVIASSNVDMQRPGTSADAQQLYQEDMLRNLEHHQQLMRRSNRCSDGAGPQQLYEGARQQQIQFEHQQQSMDLLMGSRRFDGVGPSGQSGSYDGSNVYQIPQRELFHHLSQNQSSSQLQPHPQHEQDQDQR